MGTRLYDEFMKKLKVPPVRRYAKRIGSKDPITGSDELVICIPLKGGQGVKTDLFYDCYSKLWNWTTTS